MICPVCAAQVEPERQECAGCGTDLTEYRRVYYQADLMYNDALAKIRRGRFAQAAEILCRAAGLRPDDLSLLQLWAEAERLDGHPAAAVRILLDAQALPGGTALDEVYQQALAEMNAAVASPDALAREALATERARVEEAARRLERALDRLERARAPEDVHEPL